MGIECFSGVFTYPQSRIPYYVSNKEKKQRPTNELTVKNLVEL